MLSRMVFFVLGLPVAVFCALLAPIVYITVIAVSPLGLLYRYVVKPVFTGPGGAGAANAVHRPTA